MKKTGIVVVIALLLLIGAVAIPVFSQEEADSKKPQILIEQTMEKKLPPGKKLEEVATGETGLLVSPGSILIYWLTCTNVGQEMATEVVITSPVPEGTEYIMESATGDSSIVTFSIDREKTYQPPQLPTWCVSQMAP